jgi:hypothetical protein
MTCRVARSFQNYPQMEPISCCECGSTHLEAFLTSKALGPYLCPLCAQATIECGTSVESQTRPPIMRGHPVA